MNDKDELIEELKQLRSALEQIGNRIGTPVLDWGSAQMKVTAYEELIQEVSLMIRKALGTMTPQEKMLKAQAMTMDFMFNALGKGGDNATG